MDWRTKKPEFRFTSQQIRASRESAPNSARKRERAPQENVRNNSKLHFANVHRCSNKLLERSKLVDIIDGNGYPRILTSVGTEKDFQSQTGQYIRTALQKKLYCFQFWNAIFFLVFVGLSYSYFGHIFLLHRTVAILHRFFGSFCHRIRYPGLHIDSISPDKWCVHNVQTAKWKCYLRMSLCLTLPSSSHTRKVLHT